MKKLLALLSAAALATGVFATDATDSSVYSSKETFEGFEVDTQITTGTKNASDDMYWFDSSAENENKVKAYETPAAGNEKYLSISTSSGSPLYRMVAEHTEQDDLSAASNPVSIGDGIYIDTLVKMEGSSDAPTPPDGAKLMVWVQSVENEGDVPGYTNLVVTAAQLDANGTPTPKHFVIETEDGFDFDAWHQLTIRAISDVTADAGIVGFTVFIDQKQVAAKEVQVAADGETVEQTYDDFMGAYFSTGVLTAEAASFFEEKQLFISLVSKNNTEYAQKLSAVGFDGTGFVDNVNVTATAPDFTKSCYFFTVNWTANTAGFTLTAGDWSTNFVTGVTSAGSEVFEIPATANAVTLSDVIVVQDSDSSYASGEGEYSLETVSAVNVVVKTNLGTIDGEPFTDFATALAAADGKTMTLATSFSLAETTISGNVTIDLAGYTLTFEPELDDFENSSIFGVEQGASLKIVDSVGGGAVVYADGASSMYLINATGTFILGDLDDAKDKGATIGGAIMDNMTPYDPDVSGDYAMYVRGSVIIEGNYSDDDGSGDFSDGDAVYFAAFLYADENDNFSTIAVDGDYFVITPPAAEEPEVNVAQVGDAQFTSLEAALAAASENDTIKLIANVDLTTHFVVGKTVTLDLNGYTIGNAAPMWDDDAATTVDGAQYNVVSMIRVVGGTLTITDSSDAKTGAVAALQDDCYCINADGGNLVINAGRFVGNITCIQAVGPSAVTINGGEFSILQTWEGSYQYLLNCMDESGASIVVNAGTFYGFDPANNSAEGANTDFCAAAAYSYLAETVDGVSVYVVAPAVAKIGNVKYPTLEAALAEAVEGNTITLLANVELTADVTVDKSVTLAVGANTVTLPAGKTITVAEGKSLAVTCGTGGLVIDGTIAVNGTLDVSGLSYGTSGLIANKAGNLAIGATGSVKLMSAWDAFSPNWLATNSSTFFADSAEGAKLVQGSGTYTFNGTTWLVENAVAVTQVTANGKTYQEGFATLAAAITASVDGNITLLANVALDTTFVVEEALTLDMGGNTVTAEFAYSASTPAAFWVKNGGNLTLKNGTLSTTVEGIRLGVKKATDAATKGTATIESDVVITTTDIGVMLYGGSTLNSSGTITSSSTGFAAIQGNGLDTLASTINITDGSVSSTGNHAIYHPQPGTLTIKGGTVSGVTGIEMRAGTLNMEDGTVAATGTYAEPGANNSGSTVNGAAIVLSQHSTGKNVTANITGGEITAGDNGKTFVVANTTGADPVNVTATIAAAVTFEASKAVVLIDTLKLDGNETDGYMVVEKVYVASVTDANDNVTKYEVFTEALAAAESGSTVKLLADTEYGQILTLAEGVTLDLNGKSFQTLAVFGDLAMNGGSLKTYDTTTQTYYFMAAPAETAGALFWTSDAVLNVSSENYGLVLKSGAITMPNTWRSLVGQSLAINAGASFTIPENVTWNLRGNAVVNEGASLVCNGTILLGESIDKIDTTATLTTTDKTLNVVSACEGYEVQYADGAYTLVAKPTTPTINGVEIVVDDSGIITNITSAANGATVAGTLDTTKFPEYYTVEVSDGKLIIELNGKEIPVIGEVTTGEETEPAVKFDENGDFVINIQGSYKTLKYELKYLTDLSTQTWESDAQTAAEATSGTGSAMSLKDENAGTGARFYKVFVTE